MNTANVILTAGDKVFASKYSRIGDFGFTGKLHDYTAFLSKTGISTENLCSGDHKFRLNPFEPPKEEDAKWLQAMIQHMHDDMLATICKNRNISDNSDLLANLTLNIQLA